MEFLSNLNVKPPLHKHQAPPHKSKAPLLTTFWRGFWLIGWWRLLESGGSQYNQSKILSARPFRGKLRTWLQMLDSRCVAV